MRSHPVSGHPEETLGVGFPVHLDGALIVDDHPERQCVFLQNAVDCPICFNVLCRHLQVIRVVEDLHPIAQLCLHDLDDGIDHQDE